MGAAGAGAGAGAGASLVAGADLGAGAGQAASLGTGAPGAGLIAGMGYLGFAVLFTVIMCLVFMLYHRLDFGAGKNAERYKILTVTIPEDLNYTDVFADIFGQYTESAQLANVKTTNMGSMFKLTYQVTLRADAQEKEMIDKIRCRNGNLEVALSRQDSAIAEL